MSDPRYDYPPDDKPGVPFPTDKAPSDEVADIVAGFMRQYGITLTGGGYWWACKVYQAGALAAPLAAPEPAQAAPAVATAGQTHCMHAALEFAIDHLHESGFPGIADELRALAASPAQEAPPAAAVWPYPSNIIAAFEGIERALESIPEGVEGYLDELSEAVDAARVVFKALEAAPPPAAREQEATTAPADDVREAAGEHLARAAGVMDTLRAYLPKDFIATLETAYTEVEAARRALEGKHAV